MSTIDPTQWEQVLKELRATVRTQQFHTWFTHLSPRAFEDGVLVIEAPNDFNREWIEKNYADAIREAVHNAVRAGSPDSDVTNIDIRLVTRPSEPVVVQHNPEQQANNDSIREGLNPNYTFENFLVGPSNRLPHAAALAVVDSPGYSYNPLFVHGAVGLGKTHLVQAVCHALLDQSKPFKILYLSCEAFVNDFISTIQDGAWESFRYKYRNVDVLLIDDIQFLSTSEHTQEEFFHTFNTLYNAQKQIVITSDVAPEELPSLQERLLSRFKWGLVARIDPPAFETRAAIVQHRASAQNIHFPEDVVHVLASSIATNVRELQGAITRVIAYARVAGSPPTLELARDALRDSLPERKPVSVDDIITAVCDRYNVRVADLQSRKKSKSIVFPRQLCMYLARRLTKHSLEEIGGYFGGRDHTTVLHADGKIKQQRENDEALHIIIDRMIAEIESDR